MNHRNFFILSGCLLALSAQAKKTSGLPPFRHDPRFESQMRLAACSIPELLLKNNVDSGDLDLKTLSQEMAQVHWDLFDMGFLAGSGEQRGSAIYLVKEKRVIFNSLSLQYADQSLLSLVALHESLGALGYLDEDYQMTLSLFMLTPAISEKLGLSNKVFLDFLTKLPRRQGEAQYARGDGGGTTSVGGGGDAESLDAKLFSIVLAKAWLESRQAAGKHRGLALEEAVRALLKTSFEMNFKAQPKETFAIETKKSAKIVRLSLVLWLTVRMQGAEARNETIVQLLDQFFSEAP